MYAGVGAKLQIGKQANWSTLVAQTVAFSFDKEDIKLQPVIGNADRLVARKGTGAHHILGTKVGGSFGGKCYPDEIGLLIAAVMGAEVAPAAVDSSAVYDHVFTPMSSVAASSLPELTIAIDRVAAIKGYAVKLDSMDLEFKGGDYLRATFNVVGRHEETDTMDALTPSTKVPFNFVHAAFTVGGAAYHIKSGKISYKNNLENDLFTAYAAGGYMAEPEPQARSVSGSIDVLWDTTSAATRDATFAAGASTALVFVFTSTEAILTGKYYTLTISIPLAFVTDGNANVSGPERPNLPLTFEAEEDADDNLCTITLRDARATAYL
ncbi:phage tail tube protein [Candidatus Pacearchaeota archaeon]|jgi:hypothetical protein|nr:phage tail tube protein [Candidatus Pacearchaeota archaeon]